MPAKRATDIGESKTNSRASQALLSLDGQEAAVKQGIANDQGLTTNDDVC
jgi:hypothetical protein